MYHFPSKTNVPEERLYRAVIQGTGAADPVSVPSAANTNVFSQGFLSIKRTAIGRIAFNWRDNPGMFVGIVGHCFRDNAAQANVKGWTVTAGVYLNANGIFTLEVDIWNSLFAAVELAATSFLDIGFAFKATQA